jgi:serine phosphatase RsbU (regulator of sigma subunit)
MANAAGATLEISGQGTSRLVEVPPGGAIFGRDKDCDIVLDASTVSGRHARIWRDPSGGWIVEDLHSRNGTRVEDRRVVRQDVLSGQKISIGPFTLTLTVAGEERLPADVELTSATHLEDDAGKPLETLAGQGQRLSVGRIEQLGALSDRLGRVTRLTDLYPEFCQALAWAPEMTAMVLRLAGNEAELPASPAVLACCLSGPSGGFAAHAAARLSLSRRVLTRVCRDRLAVLGQTNPMRDGDMMLTFADGPPRTVVCAPIFSSQEAVEAVYVEMPTDLAADGVLDFVQAVAGTAGLLRRNLVLTEDQAQRQAMARELTRAQRIQQALLPRELSGTKGFEVNWHYQPMSGLGGDYCDVWPLADGRLAFAVGDVTGHGLDAAMVMASAHAAMRAFAASEPKPAGVIEGVNRYLAGYLPDGMFMTLVLGFYDPASGHLAYVRAGENPPLIVRADGQASPLFGGAPMLGIESSAGYTEDALELAPGETVLAFTDGIVEARSPQGEEFGRRRVQELIRTVWPAGSKDLVAAVADAAAAFRRPLGPQDDVTVLALRRHAAEG